MNRKVLLALLLVCSSAVAQEIKIGEFCTQAEGKMMEDGTCLFLGAAYKMAEPTIESIGACAKSMYLLKLQTGKQGACLVFIKTDAEKEIVQQMGPHVASIGVGLARLKRIEK